MFSGYCTKPNLVAIRHQPIEQACKKSCQFLHNILKKIFYISRIKISIPCFILENIIPENDSTAEAAVLNTLKRRPSFSKMHRTTSTADISKYKISEGAIKLMSVSNLILLIASLVMIATGILSQKWAKIRKKCNLEKLHFCLAQ